MTAISSATAELIASTRSLRLPGSATISERPPTTAPTRKSEPKVRAINPRSRVISLLGETPSRQVSRSIRGGSREQAGKRVPTSPPRFRLDLALLRVSFSADRAAPSP